MRVSGLTSAHEILTCNLRRTSLEVFPNVSIFEWHIFVFHLHSYLLVTFLDAFNYRNSSPSQRASHWLSGKESACSAGDPGSIPGSGRSPGEGHGTPLQYSCLENPTDRGPWRATVREVTESDTTEYLTPEAG